MKYPSFAHLAVILALLALVVGALTVNGAQVATSLYGIFVSSAGNVGILTYAPQEKLTLASGKNFAIELAAPTISTVSTSSIGGAMATGTYYYVLIARNGVGSTTYTSQVTAANITGTTSSVGLVWSAVPGATSYSLYRTATSGRYVSPSFVFSTTTTAATDTLATASLGAGAPLSYTDAYTVKVSATSTSWLTGNLGIGTSTPAKELDLFSAGTTTVRLDSITAGGCLAVRTVQNSGYVYFIADATTGTWATTTAANCN